MWAAAACVSECFSRMAGVWKHTVKVGFATAGEGEGSVSGELASSARTKAAASAAVAPIAKRIVLAYCRGGAEDLNQVGVEG